MFLFSRAACKYCQWTRVYFIVVKQQNISDLVFRKQNWVMIWKSVRTTDLIFLPFRIVFSNHVTWTIRNVQYMKSTTPQEDTRHFFFIFETGRQFSRYVYIFLQMKHHILSFHVHVCFMISKTKLIFKLYPRKQTIGLKHCHKNTFNVCAVLIEKQLGSIWSLKKWTVIHRLQSTKYV